MRFQKGHTPWCKGKNYGGMSGKKHSQLTKNKIGKTNAIKRKGSKIPDHVKEKMSEAHKGEKSYLWKGGISKEVGYKSFIQKRRVLRLKNSGGSFSYIEWCDLKKRFNFTCVACGKKEPEIKLTIDHIKPISKGGVDSIENIQPLCGGCNNKKATKEVDYRLLIKVEKGS